MQAHLWPGGMHGGQPGESAIELWNLGYGGQSMVWSSQCNATTSRTCHSTTLSVSEPGARDMPEVGQEGVSLRVRNEV